MSRERRTQAEKFQGEAIVPHLVGDFQEAASLHRARTIDQDIDPAIGAPRGLGERLASAEAAKITREVLGAPPARLRDLRRGTPQVLLAAGRQQAIRPVRGQPGGDGAANPAAAPSDNRDLPFQLSRHDLRPRPGVTARPSLL